MSCAVAVKAVSVRFEIAHVLLVILWMYQLLWHFYWPQRSWGRECLPQCMLGYHPPEGDTHPPPGKEAPPGTMHPPRKEAPTPPGTMHPPLRHTVNERPVRILLECILVYQALFLRICLFIELGMGTSQNTCISGNQLMFIRELYNKRK